MTLHSLVLLRKFLQLDWDSLFSSHRNNVEIMWNILKDKILEGVNKYVSSSLPFSSWKKATWKRPIDATTRSLTKQKIKHWKHYVKSKDPKVMASYKLELVRIILNIFGNT